MVILKSNGYTLTKSLPFINPCYLKMNEKEEKKEQENDKTETISSPSFECVKVKRDLTLNDNDLVKEKKRKRVRNKYTNLIYPSKITRSMKNEDLVMGLF